MKNQLVKDDHQGWGRNRSKVVKTILPENHKNQQNTSIVGKNLYFLINLSKKSRLLKDDILYGLKTRHYDIRKIIW